MVEVFKLFGWPASRRRRSSVERMVPSRARSRWATLSSGSVPRPVSISVVILVAMFVSGMAAPDCDAFNDGVDEGYWYVTTTVNAKFCATTRVGAALGGLCRGSVDVPVQSLLVMCNW